MIVGCDGDGQEYVLCSAMHSSSGPSGRANSSTTRGSLFFNRNYHRDTSGARLSEPVSSVMSDDILLNKS